MIDVRHRVLPQDYVKAAREARCIDECINVAAAGMAMDNLEMVRDRLKDAQRSMQELDRLIQYKKDRELIKEFISVEAIKAYEKQMGVKINGG